MNRSFETHIIREEKSLDGLWNFKMDGFEKFYTMPVPGCWEQHPDFVSHRGKATYTKSVYVKKDSNIRFEFKGISHSADVYFDSKKIAHHYNAYTPFSAVVNNVSQGEHELKIEVSNQFGEDSALHMPNDYYTYGGIIRPVTMEYIPDVYIKRIHFTPSLKNAVWSGKTQVCISNISDTDKTVTLHTSLADKTNEKTLDIAASSETIYEFEESYPGIIPWSNKNPQLYLLKAQINGDDLYVTKKRIDLCKQHKSVRF